MPAPAVILIEPQLAENIGAVARAMANFGLSDLRLAAPRDGWPQPRAWASASGADWVLDDARVFDNAQAAIADLRLVIAATARPREVALPVMTPRAAVSRLRAAGSKGWPTGLLFGGERAGLSTDDVSLCHAIVTAPVDPRFRSLNLAQAVAILAYEWGASEGDPIPAEFVGVGAPADQAAMAGLFAHLERELDTGGFFHPPEKRASMIRNLRTPLNRARFTAQEARTFRGVVTALAKGRGRVLAKLAAQRKDK
jgi:tRNA/rRNA methyltransferase